MKLVKLSDTVFALNKASWKSPIVEKYDFFYLYFHPLPAKFIEPVNLLEISIRDSVIQNIRENS